MAFVRLIDVEQCVAGKGAFVEAGGRRLAVFRLEGPERFAVIDNDCPHAGAPLCAGDLDGEIVTCPMHLWEFDVTTGQGRTSREARVRSYPVQVRDGAVWADL